MERFVFFYECKNGDCPTVFATDAIDVKDAVKQLVINHKQTYNITVGNRYYDILGNLKTKWPGPQMVLQKKDGTEEMLWDGRPCGIMGLEWEHFFSDLERGVVRFTGTLWDFCHMEDNK